MSLICEGPPGLGVNCPYNKRGHKSVRLVHDLELCRDCQYVRFGTVTSRPNSHAQPTLKPIAPLTVQMPPINNPIQTMEPDSSKHPRNAEPSVSSKEQPSAWQTPSNQGNATAANDNASSPIINELLCFVSNKLSSIPYDMLIKLCTDFYKTDDISCAKDIMYTLRLHQDIRRKVKHRGNEKAHRDIQDIVDILLELPLHATPMFVCKNLSNLPPLSMNNFDMASVIKKLEQLQQQVNLLTDNQNKCVDAHVTLCNNLMPSGQGTAQKLQGGEPTQTNSTTQGSMMPTHGSTGSSQGSTVTTQRSPMRSTVSRPIPRPSGGKSTHTNTPTQGSTGSTQRSAVSTVRSTVSTPRSSGVL